MCTTRLLPTGCTDVSIDTEDGPYLFADGFLESKAIQNVRCLSDIRGGTDALNYAFRLCWPVSYEHKKGMSLSRKYSNAGQMSSASMAIEQRWTSSSDEVEHRWASTSDGRRRVTNVEHRGTSSSHGHEAATSIEH